MRKNLTVNLNMKPPANTKEALQSITAQAQSIPPLTPAHQSIEMDHQVLVSTIAAAAVVVNTEVHPASIVMDTALVVVKVRREALPARHISIAVALVAVSIRKGVEALVAVSIRKGVAALVAVSIRKGVAALVVRVKKGIVPAQAILRKSPTAHHHHPKTNTETDLKREININQVAALGLGTSIETNIEKVHHHQANIKSPPLNQNTVKRGEEKVMRNAKKNIRRTRRIELKNTRRQIMSKKKISRRNQWR